MATVRGMTPEEILENIDEMIVQGVVNSSGDLILTTRGGDVYNAGHVVGGGGSGGGLIKKTAVLVATTTNITLSGTQTIDSVSVVDGDRVLVKDQTLPAENGIYVCSAGAWARSADADTWNELISAYVFAQAGGQINTGFLCTVDSTGTLGTTDVTWVWFTVPTVPISKGGTGATTAYGARYNTGAPGAQNGLLPALTAGVWTTVVTLNPLADSSGLLCEFHDDTTKERVLIDYRTNGSPANLQVRADIAVAANTIRYALMVRGV